MVQNLNPEGYKFTKQKFDIFKKEFNSDLSFSNYKSNKTKELAREICPLAKASINATSKAIECLRLPNQFERRANCYNQSCPLLYETPIQISVKGSHESSNIYQLNPVNGEITTLERIKRGRPRVFQFDNLENEPINNNEPSKPGETPFASDIRSILSYENRIQFKKLGIKIPKILAPEFVRENTEFRMIGPLKDVELLPVDNITLDIAGWAYEDSCLEPMTLTKRSSYTIEQTLLRMPFVKPIVNDINSTPFPLFRFMEVHKMYEDKL